MFSSSFYPSSRKAQVSALAVAAAAAGLLAMFPARASANEIGIDFSNALNTNSATPVPIPANTLAGVVPQLNWNNAATATNPDTLATVVDNTGATVSNMTATYGANGSFDNYSAGGNFTSADPNQIGDQDLYSAAIHTFNGTGSPGSYYSTITVTNIPYATYDVYAYVSSAGNTLTNGTPGLVNFNGTLSGTTLTGGTTVSYTSANSAQYGSNYVQITNGGVGNYVLLQNVTGSTLNVYESSTNGEMEGIQIVQAEAPIPEPATLGLMAVAGAGLLLVGRKRKVA